VSRLRRLLNKNILIGAALVSVVVSAAYACPYMGYSMSYSLCRQISLAGVPGILIAAEVSIVMLGGAHGGGPLGMLLLIATPINFLLYVGLGVAAQSVGKMFGKKNGIPS
jgi:hypothetical protein